jgi:tripartite-type tricarboxylate transporter receptor subunit TctC
MFEAMPTLVGYIQSGKLRALGVSTATRSAVFPNIPTIREFVPGYESSVWFGIAARRQTPAEIVELLNKEINAGLSDSTLNARLGEFGGIALKGTPAEFERLFVGDAQKWAEVMRAANKARIGRIRRPLTSRPIRHISGSPYKRFNIAAR